MGNNLELSLHRSDALEPLHTFVPEDHRLAARDALRPADPREGPGEMSIDPAGSGLRRIPIVEPTPLMPWSIVWHRRNPRPLLRACPLPAPSNPWGMGARDRPDPFGFRQLQPYDTVRRSGGRGARSPPTASRRCGGA
ncbi:hypothetical protein ACIBQ1_40815 [Nonomuraea sp. NPDC050153]|uniref:hypothetical protein n=1 Tax=Nonomuraea sp. NPDC050153 TaxID=3364359 RepID=UPI0037A66F36